MNSLHRATLSVALTLAPMMGTGCVMTSGQYGMTRTTPRFDNRMCTARLEENRGNLVHAKQLYAEIHRLNPQDAECLHRLAVVCTRLKEEGQADVYYRQAYEINPNNAELLSDMGYVAFLKKDYEQSETLLEQSVRINGNDHRTINNLGIVRAWRQKDEASLTAFRQIHTEADAIRHLASIQFARGDSERGQKNTDLANRLDGRNSSSAIAQNTTTPNQNAIELPAPSPPDVQRLAQAPAQQATQSAQQTIVWSQPIQESETDRNINLTTNIVAEATIELPAPTPPQPDEPPASTNERRESARRAKFVTASTCAMPSRSSFVPDKNASVRPSLPESIEKVVDVIEEAVVVPSPDIEFAEPARTETAMTVVESQSTRQPSIWRKTPPSRCVPVDRGEMLSSRASDIRPTSANFDALDEKASFKNICLVSLFEDRRLVPTLPEFASEFQSQEYRFSSAEALEKFRANPLRYAPAAGGLDVVSVRNERSVVQGSLNFAVWYRHQLFLFSTSEHAEAFRREPHKFVASE